MRMARQTHCRRGSSESLKTVLCKTQTDECRKTGGQALIEVCVCLVGIVVILIAMVELTKISMIHIMTITQARANVASIMQDEIVLFPTANFLQTWDAGPDGKRYTADDVPVTATVASFHGTTVEKSVPNAAYWSVFADNPNKIVGLHNTSPLVAPFFGLLKGQASETTQLLPGFQRFIYGAETITIQSEAWMTWTKGIY